MSIVDQASDQRMHHFLALLFCGAHPRKYYIWYGFVAIIPLQKILNDCCAETTIHILTTNLPICRIETKFGTVSSSIENDSKLGFFP